MAASTMSRLPSNPGRRTLSGPNLQDDRYGHVATFDHLRPDKRPGDCRYDQLEVTAPYELSRVFSSAG